MVRILLILVLSGCAQKKVCNEVEEIISDDCPKTVLLLPSLEDGKPGVQVKPKSKSPIIKKWKTEKKLLKP